MFRAVFVLNFFFSCQLGIYHCVPANNTIHAIDFYATENYTELLYKFYANTTRKCNNFPLEKKTLKVRSISTTQCWILFRDPNCKSLYSEKITTNFSWEDFHQIGSFRICIEEKSLHVDLIYFYADIEVIPSTLESYKDVCSCHNIPHYILNLDEWYISNRGIDLVAYYEQDCREKKFTALFVPAGRAMKAMKIYKYEKFDTYRMTHSNYRIQSFGPNFNSSYFRNYCVKLNGTVVKFEIEDKAEFEETDLHIDMFNNVFRNDGHNGMKRTYFISKVVEERFHVEVDSSLATLSKITVDPDFEVESNFEHNIFGELAFKEVLKKAYSNSSKSKNTELSSFKTFSVKQVLNIPPCTEHKLSAHVNMLRNDRIQFKALMKISGFIEGRAMVAAEVKRYMDKGMEYKGDHDGNTVLAYAKGFVGINFEAYMVIEGKDIAITECVAYNQLLTCPACEVCF